MTEVIEGLRSALADRYAVQEELGRGGMATVYLAEDLKYHRQVAIKVLHPDLGASLATDRFLREIQIAAQLNHPHILALLDSGEANGFLYYVMPVVEGESLGDRLSRETQLTVEEAVRLTREIADALGAAHEMGVVHRDLKPENVLLSGDHAILADFGIARAVTVGGGDKLTETGLVVGTPSYMAPEQATGSDKIDARTDVYALGCVLYEMLAGEPPFNGPTPMAVLARHSLERVPSIRIVRQTVPVGLEAVLEKAMAKVPVDRYATAAEMAAALEASLREPADASVPPARGVRPVRSRVPVALVTWSAVALVVMLGAGVWSQWGGRPPQLNTNLIAVAPFAAFDPALESWSQAAEAGLSRTLDGMGPLRALAPTAINREGIETIDAASAVTIGDRSGVGVLVFGSLTPLGSDSVQGRITVVDVASGEPMGDLSATSGLDRMSDFVDSLTIGIIGLMTDGRQLGAGPLTGLSSASVPAVKAILRGDRQIRRAAYDSAIASYDIAIENDSSNALAYYRKGLVRGFDDGQLDSLFLYLSRAGELNRGLNRHDSLLVHVGGCIADTRLDREASDSLTRERADQCRAIALDMTIEFPDDAEAWSALALVRRHLGWFIEITEARGTPLATFDSAIVKDPDYGLMYLMAVKHAFDTQQYQDVQRLSAMYIERGWLQESMGMPLLLARVLDPAGDPLAKDRLLDSLSTCVLMNAVWGLLPLTDSVESHIRIARALNRGNRTDARCFFSAPAHAQQFLSASLLYRGHLEEAAVADTLRGFGFFPTVFPEIGIWGGVPPTTADSVFHAWVSSDALPSYTDRAAWWWAQRGDTASIKEFLRRRPDADGPVWSAFLELARRDTTAALREFERADDGSQHDWPLAWAQLLIARGQDREALEALRLGTPGIGWHTMTLVHLRLERARVAERLGETETALEDYQFVIDAWIRADERFQGYVQEARDAVLRLGS